MNYVICRECGEEHDTIKVKFVNVEEDIHGRDVFIFACPITGTTTRSFVMSKPDEHDWYWTEG